MGKPVVIKGKGISKSDNQLVEAIMAGEMKNAWQKGDGVDHRAEKPSWTHRTDAYRENYERTFGHG